LYSAQVEKAVIQSVRSALDLGENFGIVFGKARRDSFASFLGLLAEGTTEARCRDFFEVRILLERSC
jgi:hypothetical protein